MEEIIELVHQAGGKAVLAHPKLVYDDAIVQRICASGIDGMECFYPQHDEAETQKYLAMAKEHRLMITGGSDFHGIPTRYPAEVGVFTVDDAYAEPLYQPES